ncbi:RHS repeat-associated core domain-containing protein [Pseudomonas sp. Pseusp122]|uniref:RHS repeat-associated core domain-containing protein n=1 Tax=unclassified Pseudomonas TaxID=196821 RepID=UPI0039A4BC8F
MCATTTLLATDSRNTPLAAVDPVGSNLLAYTPYGAQSAVKPVHNQLGFNGQLRERPTGWYHLGNGHRVYNPVLMRFHTPDTLSPFGKGGLNAYAYCVGDPVNLVDPTGQMPEWLQSVLTITLHTLVIAATGLAAMKSPPTGIALYAARMSMIGSPMAITGAAMQLAGVKEGRYLSALGTGISAVGGAMRAYQGGWEFATDPELRGKAMANLRQFFGISAKPMRVPGPPPHTGVPLRASITSRTREANIQGYLAAVANSTKKNQQNQAWLAAHSKIQRTKDSIHAYGLDGESILIPLGMAIRR